jgi:curved DNA-binding protein CbpA
MIPDYYALLGVSPDASAAEIKRAYRRLVRRHHPDLNAQAQDAQIKRLNEAYEILGNPRKRAAYDKQRGRKQAGKEPKMSWAEGVGGFVRELKKEAAFEQPAPKPKMSWAEGMGGFARELKKGMRED